MLDKLLATACLTVLTAGVALADDHGDMAGDPEKGERTFRKCMACHAVGEDADTKTGPVLNGIVGKDIASTEDFDYSDALMELDVFAGRQGSPATRRHTGCVMPWFADQGAPAMIVDLPGRRL